MLTRREIENFSIRKSEDICLFAEMIGNYRDRYGQLQCNNGAFVSSLLNFLDDNPGAMEALRDWVLENYDLEEENEDDSNED